MPKIMSDVYMSSIYFKKHKNKKYIIRVILKEGKIVHMINFHMTVQKYFVYFCTNSRYFHAHYQ